MTDGQRGCGRHAGEASDFSAPVAVADGRGGAPQESCGFCSEGLTGQKRATRPLTSLATAREQLEKDYILSVLERVDGSRTTGAKILGLSRKAQWEQGKRYGIPSAREEAEDEG
jgi:two-component system response regulator HydG